MPTLFNFLLFIYVNLGFIIQIAIMYFYTSLKEVQDDWPTYRCVPTNWIYSDNITEDFNYCVQNSQVNMMGYLLQPMTYATNSLTSLSGNFSESINKIRAMISNIRDFVKKIIESVFGVFLNLIVEFQKMIISIKDMVGKLIGIVVTVMYILDGSIKTMNSAWKGPPGQMVQALGSCFHPNTRIRLKNGKIYNMEDLPLGEELENGGKVFSVMKLDNPNKEKYYRIKNGGVDNDDILVTGEHFIFDKEQNTFVKVKNYKYAIIDNDLEPATYLSSLITTNRRIPIGNNIFWDWEDDELTK